MSSWSEGHRPITLAILALGGEGGGVLADWIVAAAEGAGHIAQNTSVAGVAQRTGATVYYVEIFPPYEPSANGRVRPEPVMSIFPTPGEVDIVITSELMESGRAIQRGFATPDRTTLITSTSRVYSIDEKMALGDGRVDDRELLAGAERAAKRLVAADFARLAEDNGTVISASLFGALAGSGALPFTREQFEAPIRAFGKAVEPSLAGFEAGFQAATVVPSAAEQTVNADPAEPAAPDSAGGPAIGVLPVSTWAGTARTADDDKANEELRRNEIAATDPASLVGPELRALAQRTSQLPATARSMTLHGLVRTAVYQDLDYAERYFERVARVAGADPDRDGEARFTVEAARYIALWMCYQDTIYVAMQKTRLARMEKVRREAKAKDGQLLEVREFLHPQIDEITDTLPTALGWTLRRSKLFQRLVQKVTHKGMILNTTSVTGYTLLTTMARARPIRPRSLRFGREQKAIEQWLDQAVSAAATDADLAREMIECQAVLKGYGATWEHGLESFEKLMAAARSLRGTPNAASRLAQLRSAALSDEDGKHLELQLGQTAAA
jgi:indolepyruvate ferredoxin oxidoreductase, beta subunit